LLPNQKSLIEITNPYGLSKLVAELVEAAQNTKAALLAKSSLECKKCFL
jgi:hypothetical protein